MLNIDQSPFSTSNLKDILYNIEIMIENLRALTSTGDGVNLIQEKDLAKLKLKESELIIMTIGNLPKLEHIDFMETWLKNPFTVKQKPNE